MQHITSRWVWPLLIGLPIIAGRWELLPILAGVVVAGQSLHESIHHPQGTFAHPTWRFLGTAAAVLGGLLLRT
jgi:hypothetical protein